MGEHEQGPQVRGSRVCLPLAHAHRAPEGLEVGRLRRACEVGQQCRREPLALQVMGRSLEAQLQDLARTHGVDEVELRRSDRRRRTISAFRENGTLVIAAPARISAAELLDVAANLLRRVVAKERAFDTDAELHQRALRVAAAYLPAHIPAPASVRWTDARSTWGSCVSADRTICISRALSGMPEWVLDYVLVHELAHLLEANHGRQFYELVSGYPRWEQARAFLDGVSWQSRNAAGVPDSGAVDDEPMTIAEPHADAGTDVGEAQASINSTNERPPVSPEPARLATTPAATAARVEQPADLFDM